MQWIQIQKNNYYFIVSIKFSIDIVQLRIIFMKIFLKSLAILKICR